MKMKDIAIENENAKVMTMKWAEEIEGFLLANFNWIEYCDIQREVFIDENVCNYIKFPKAENGRNANRSNLQKIIYIIENSDLNEKFFGPEHSKIDVYDDNENIYIVWNVVNIDDYYELDKSEIEKLYRF